jgi:hypothetical protein
LFSHGHWKEIQSFRSHSTLAYAAKQISALVLASKTDNTNKKYKLYFDKFSRWCNLHGLLALLARPATVCLYISSLVQQCVSNSVLDAAFYSINRYHNISLHSNPCEDNLVKLTYEGEETFTIQTSK